MFSVWTQHLTGTAQENFKKEVQGSKRVLDRGVEILQIELDKIEQTEIDPNNYGPGYAYLQAHLNGVRSGLKKAQKLLTLDQGNK